jgi:hypothetical protein
MGDMTKEQLEDKVIAQIWAHYGDLKLAKEALRALTPPAPPPARGVEFTREQALEAALRAVRNDLRDYLADDTGTLAVEMAIIRISDAIAMTPAQGVDFTRGWEAGRDAVVDLFHADQLQVWSDEVLSDLALTAGMSVSSYDDNVAAHQAVLETLTEIANMARSLTPPAPAPWTPPKDRPDGFECLGKNSFGIWRHIQWSRRNEWTVRGTFDNTKPTAFAPLPPTPEASHDR